MRDPLILPLTAIVCGIVLDRAFNFSPVEAAWPLCAFLALIGLAYSRRARWLTRLLTGLVLTFLGILTDVWHRSGPPPEIDASSREVLLVDGCVVEPSVFSSDRERFTLELDPGARARISLPIEEDSPLPQRLEYGQKVEIEARIRKPRNFKNPGAFDYTGYLARQKIFWTATMSRGSQAKILPGRCGSRIIATLFKVRETALDRIEKLYAGDEYTTGMMEAVLIGETSRLEKIWTENFRRTGTFHALVISGAQVAALAGILLFFLRLCAIPEIPSLALTALAAWFYALISGFSPPVARAAGGFTLYLIARFFFRRGRVINLLAAIVIIYLLCDPADLFDASFQLSFLSVAAIGALAGPFIEATTGPLAAGLRGISNLDIDPHLAPRAAQFRVELRLIAETIHLWLHLPVRWTQELLAFLFRGIFLAFEVAMISATIQIGLALPMAEYFHRISFTGLTANLIIVPLLEFAVLVGFAAIFTNWHWLALAATWFLRIGANTADWHARLEPSWRVDDPPLWLAVVFTTTLILLAITIRHRILRWPAGLTALVLFALLLWQPWPAQLVPHNLELTTIDVGQGDSLLVVFPEGKTMIVDGGGILQYGKIQRRSNLDTGEDVVSPYLWSRGIRHIDVVAATHAHADHTGGLAAILENFHPSELWVGTNPLPSLLEQAHALGVAVKEMRSPDDFPFSGARIQVLSPPKDYVAEMPGNNDSLAIRIAYGNRAFLLTGDMERSMEQRLLGDSRSLHADVLKVGHHGSKTSTTPEFLDEVSPSIALISAGYENSFGHPHRDVLGRLMSRHLAIFRTDLDGLTTVWTDGQKLSIDSMLWHPESVGPLTRAFDWTLASER